MEEIMIRFAPSFLALAIGCIACCGCDRKAKQAAAKNIRLLTAAMKQYKQDYNAFPPNEPGLKALSATHETGGHSFGPYIDNAQALTDPWGRPYVYHHPGISQSGYDLFSSGPNGKEGDSDDIH
jgi:general secretion pathway protein G